MIRLINLDPAMETPAWFQILTGLEDYFFLFPQELLQITSVNIIYQLEAMIWTHGLFIILCTASSGLALVPS